MTISTAGFAEWLCKRIGGISTVDHKIYMTGNGGYVEDRVVEVSSTGSVGTVNANVWLGFSGDLERITLTGSTIDDTDPIPGYKVAQPFFTLTFVDES